MRSILSNLPTSMVSNNDKSISRSKLISRLSGLLISGKIKVATAKANVYWLVGQYAIEEPEVQKFAVEVVRVAVKGFHSEVRSPGSFIGEPLVTRLSFRSLSVPNSKY
jgi:hypothetical protein